MAYKQKKGGELNIQPMDSQHEAMDLKSAIEKASKIYEGPF